MQHPVTTVGPPLPSEQIYEALFKFIDTTLPLFRPYSKKENGNTVDAEDSISEDLSDFLDCEQEFLSSRSQENHDHFFKFTNQSKRSDIGVKYGRTYVQDSRFLICWIEAKRLPTPDVSHRDPREYVFVDKEKYKGGGGIHRFKMSKHAPKLNYAIMIAYIQSNTYDYWLDKLNGYIKSLIEIDSSWNEKDLIKPLFSKENNRFISVHTRADVVPDITIRHFWIHL